MTIDGIMIDNDNDEEFETKGTRQVVFYLRWFSRDKWYDISKVTFTHNPEYPTPAISVIQPQAGIRFNVYNLDGELVYSNKKTKAQDND